MWSLLLIVILGMLAITIPELYADSDFVLVGNGLGKINGKVEPTFLQMSLQVQDSGKSVFKDGQFLLGEDSYSIDEASFFLSENKKLVRVDAKTGTSSLSASGKLVISVTDGGIYQISGKTSDGNAFSIFTKLRPITQSEHVDTKNEILLLVKQTERVEWKSPYKFTIRTFDPKANPLSDFYGNSGYLEGMKISATITNPIGDVIKTSNGMTQKFGYYEDSVIIPDNARTGTYKLVVTASGEKHQSITKEFTFVVFPLNTRPS